MSPTARAIIGIGLGIVFGVCALTAAVCHFIAGNLPRSEVARRLIEHEDGMAGSAAFAEDPADELLSERGLALRARGRHFGRLAMVCAGLIFAWALWANS